jgi:hypothetical protein
MDKHSSLIVGRISDKEESFVAYLMKLFTAVFILFHINLKCFFTVIHFQLNLPFVDKAGA